MTRPYRLTAIEVLFILAILLWSRYYTGPMGVVLGLGAAVVLLELDRWWQRGAGLGG